jgi:hypothetical protein
LIALTCSSPGRAPGSQAGDNGALAAGHERHDDVGGMTIEVLPSAVIDGCRSRVGVASGELDVPQGQAGVERGHDEGGPEHVGMDEPEPGLLSNGADPAVRRTTVETLSVVSVAPGGMGQPERQSVRIASGSTMLLLSDHERDMPGPGGPLCGVSFGNLRGAPSNRPPHHRESHFEWAPPKCHIEQ